MLLLELGLIDSVFHALLRALKAALEGLPCHHKGLRVGLVTDERRLITSHGYAIIFTMDLSLADYGNLAVPIVRQLCMFLSILYLCILEDRTFLKFTILVVAL